MTRAIVLFAHGARDPRWAEPFEAVAARVRAADASLQVRLAYLELMTPTLQEAGRDLALAGCDRVEIVPLFLGAGGHVKEDIPRLIASANPAVPVSVDPPIGEQARLIEAIAEGIASPR